MKKFCFFGLLVVLFACSKPDTSVQVIRNPVIAFSGNTMSWRADTYAIGHPEQVVQYPANTSLSGKIYNRYRMQATGRDDKGQRWQLIVQFDSADPNHLRGDYRPAYTADRGLASIQLYNLEQNSLAVYSLSAADTAAARLQVDRQSESERLLAGTFRGTLSNERDTSRKIMITNGVFTDVHYNP